MSDDRLLAALDRVARSAVGLTATSLAQVAPRPELTLIQWRGLAVVAESGDPVRVGEIARRLGTALPSASRLIRRLERHGFVTVVRDETDRRAALVELTPEGVRLWAAVVARRREALARLVRTRTPLPPTLVEGLETIAASLDGLA